MITTSLLIIYATMHYRVLVKKYNSNNNNIKLVNNIFEYNILF